MQCVYFQGCLVMKHTMSNWNISRQHHNMRLFFLVLWLVISTCSHEVKATNQVKMQFVKRFSFLIQIFVAVSCWAKRYKLKMCSLKKYFTVCCILTRYSYRCLCARFKDSATQCHCSQTNEFDLRHLHHFGSRQI